MLVRQSKSSLLQFLLVDTNKVRPMGYCILCLDVAYRMGLRFHSH